MDTDKNLLKPQYLRNRFSPIRLAFITNAILICVYL